MRLVTFVAGVAVAVLLGVAGWWVGSLVGVPADTPGVRAKNEESPGTPGVLAEDAIGVGLTEMVAWSHAVNLARIESAEPVVIRDRVTCPWYPSHFATFRRVESWRGELPETFRVQVELSEGWLRAAVGDVVLVFAGDVYDEMPWSNDFLRAYPAAQGVMSQDHFVWERGPAEQRLVVSAIREAVAASRPPPGGPVGKWPALNDEALAPFLRLSRHADHRVRYWAATTLCSARPTPTVEARLVELLKDEDPHVSGVAARHLTCDREKRWYGPLREYLDRLPPDPPGGHWSMRMMVRRYLAGEK